MSIVDVVDVDLPLRSEAIRGLKIQAVEWHFEHDAPVVITDYFATIAATLGDITGAVIAEFVSTDSIAVIYARLGDVTGSVIAEFVLPDSIAVIHARLGDVTGAVQLSIVNNLLTIAGTLGGITGSVSAKYDINVHRVTASQCGCVMQDARDLSTAILADAVKTTAIIQSINSAFMSAMPVSASLTAQPGMTALIYTNAMLVSGDGRAIMNNYQAVIDVLDWLTQSILAVNGDALAISKNWLSVQDVLKFLLSDAAIESGDCYQRHYLALWRKRKAIIRGTVIKCMDIGFIEDDDLPFVRVITPENTALDFIGAIGAGVFSTVALSSPSQSQLFRRKLCALLQNAGYPARGKSVRIDLPRPPAPPQPPTHQSLVIPLREVYTVQHSISVLNQAGIAIPLSKISLSLDVDSYAWQFSGVLADKAALSDVNMTDNSPEQLTITINGSVWVMLVESVEQSRSFGSTNITLKGRSLSALLGSPYQIQGSYTGGSDLTVQQIANALIPFDWTIDWQSPTWLVPANAYSHTQQTPLQALASIAGFIGASLIPSRFEKVIKIQPRYPVLPWNFNAAGITPDLIIPESAIITVNTQSRTQSPISGVYVHGGAVGGVLAWCRLNGTAGDVLASTNSNCLITDATACRLLGERILAGVATQPTISSFTLPLGGDFVLAEVGQLVQVMGERGIINGVSISVDFGKVSQTITIGENTSNAYSKLTALLPHYPLLVGNLVTTYSDMAILTLLGGGVITARGVGVIGENYYVRNGLIESSAPNLTAVEIVV